MSPPRILIFGTGSVGAVYTWLLSRVLPSSNLVTVCRSNYSAISQNGITVHSELWGSNLQCRPVVVRSVIEATALDPETPFDYILVCSKALQTIPSTPEILQPAVSPETVIVLIQNGIAIEEPYVKLFPRNRVLSTVVYLPATQISPGVVQHTALDLLHIGSYPASKNTEVAEKFAQLLRSAGASAVVHEDVQFERWSKLLINASWNPICTLAMSRDAEVLHSSPDAEGFVRDVMLEIAAVSHACGQPGIDDDLIAFQMKRGTDRPLPGLQPSMMADAIERKNMEVEAIVGNLVRLAKEKGIKTPMLRTIYILANALDQSFSRDLKLLK